MQTNRPGHLPWDLEQAMTAFQVHPSWYEDYWLKPQEQRSLGLIPRIFRKAGTAVNWLTALNTEAMTSLFRSCAKRWVSAAARTFRTSPLTITNSIRFSFSTSIRLVQTGFGCRSRRSSTECARSTELKTAATS
jgi:hypothetical protein